MNRWTTLAFGVLAPVATFAQVATQTAPKFAAHVLTRAEFDALNAKPENLLIIDVRRPDEISAIGGFPVYLNIQTADVDKHLSSIPKDRTIVAISNHANRAGRVADVLTAKGYKVAGVLGVQNYEQDGGAVTHIVPPAKAAGAANAKP